MPDEILPPKVYRVEFFFHQETYGWSETWWYRSTENIDQVLNRADDLAGFRVQMLAAGCFLDEFSVSLQGLYRDSRQSDTEPTNARPCNVFQAENSFTAILVRLQAGSRYRRPLYLRGFPKDMHFPIDGEEEATVAFAEAFGRFKAYLEHQNKNWVIQSVSKEPGDQGQAITSFVAGPGAFADYTAVVPSVAAAVVGDTVRLRSVRNARDLNVPASGLYKVMFTDDTKTVLGAPWLGANDYEAGATIFKGESLFYVGGMQAIPLRRVRRKAGLIHLQAKAKKAAAR